MAVGGQKSIALAAMLALLCACDAASTSTDAGIDGSRMDGGDGDVGGVDPDGDATGGDAFEPPEPSDPPPVLTSERFFQERRRLMCSHYVRCGARDRRQGICHPAVEDPWESIHEAALALGTSRFDPEGGRACLQALADAVVFCSSELILFPDAEPEASWLDDACDFAFIGSLAEGESCSVGAGECATGLSCLAELGGRCWRPARSDVGGSCAIDLDCGASEEESTELYCREDGTCQQRGVVDDACTTGSCATNLWCDEGRCAPLPRAGEVCDPVGVCASGNYLCVDGVCVPGAAAGEDCATWPCRESLACREDDSAATCRTTDGRYEGDACWVIVGRLRSNCRDGLHCRADAWVRSAGEELGVGECIEGRGLLMACSAAEPCARGLRCVDATCLRASVIGGPCTDDRQCPLHHWCDADECRPLASLGAEP